MLEQCVRTSKLTNRFYNIVLTPFFRTYPLLFYKFENILIFPSENLYSLCNLENQDYQQIIHFNFFTKKGRNRQQKSTFYWN